MDNERFDAEKPENAVLQCPHCGVATHHCLLKPLQHTLGYSVPIFEESDEDRRVGNREFRHLIYACVVCEKHLYILIAKEFARVVNHVSSESYPMKSDVDWQIIFRFPPFSSLAHPAVPLAVATASQEAEKCMAIGAASACGTMVRRAIDALCQEKKAAGANVFQRLEKLRDLNAITPDIWQWAEELRTAGK